MHVFKSVLSLIISVALIAPKHTLCDGFKISTHVPTRALKQLMLTPKSFYFIRHGQTDWNIENRLQGQLDIPLNDTGRSQALALQDAVKTLDINHVYFSPLSRTFETMRIVCEHIGHIPQTPVLNLMERNFGEWQGEIWDQAAVTLYKDKAPVYGETEEAYFTRVVNCANELLETCDGKMLMVAHGGVFWSLCQAAGIEYEAINNCCILHFIAPDENNNEWRIEEI